MRIDIVTIFPDFFAAPLALSIPARATASAAVTYNVLDLRDFTHDRHRTVDDYPYGGGAGMVMKPEPFFEAVESLQIAGPVVLLSPRGRRFSHADAVRFAASETLTLLRTLKDISESRTFATEETRRLRPQRRRAGRAGDRRCNRAPVAGSDVDLDSARGLSFTTIAV